MHNYNYNNTMNSDLNEKEFLLKRKKKKYNKIEKNTKNKLIKLVLKYNWLLKDAAKELKMNYSTAKTIMKKNRDKKKAPSEITLNQQEIFDYSNPNEKTQSFLELKVSPTEGTKVCSETTKCKCRDNNLETCINTVQMIELSQIVKKCLEATQMNQQITILSSIISAFRSSFLNYQETSQLLSLLKKVDSL